MRVHVPGCSGSDPPVYILHITSTFSTGIQEELHQALDGYTYHLLRDGEEIVF